MSNITSDENNIIYNDNTILNDVSQAIHHTPLIRLQYFSIDTSINIYAKCEMFNPSLSIKDRIALNMINAAKKSGSLKAGGTIIEASSGNTGCSVAMLAACLNYKAIITAPAKTSIEKIVAMRAFGATVLISAPEVTHSSPEHYINKAKILHDQTPNSVLLNQYENPVNLRTHYEQTAHEIWTSLKGNVDCIIACSSSGGTVSGIGRYFKEKKPNTKIVMPDPEGSIYYKYFKTKTEDRSSYRSYRLEGIGKDYICGVIDFSVIDDVVPVTDQEAFTKAKLLAKHEGILAGGSSGAALYVAELYANKYQQINESANIAVLLPDSGFKYLSTFYNQEKHKCGT